MKRYLLFAGENCYEPLGGWDDLVSCHDTALEAVEAAREFLKEEKDSEIKELGYTTTWFHVVDSQDGFKVVSE